MMGVFVQLNEGSNQAANHPVGYVIQENGCWEWVGARFRTGYGTWYIGRERLAHRMMFKKHRGPIPSHLVVDHLCRNRACVNPDHMELVTNGENTLRGEGPCAQNRRKTHCKHGHSEWALESRGWGRRCRGCGRERAKTAKRAKRRLGR